jgi:hypothetical protein
MSRDSQPLRVRPITYDQADTGLRRRRGDHAVSAHTSNTSRPKSAVSARLLIVLFLCAAAIGGALASLFGMSAGFAV